MRFTLHSCVGVLLATVAAEAAAAPALAPLPHYDEIARRVASRFPRKHLSRQPLDDEVSQRTWTNYIASLDFDRVYFRASDIREFASARTTLDDSLKDGGLDFPYRVFEVFKQRLQDRYDYVCALLDKGFDLELDEAYIWKRKDAPWAESEDAWNDLWRKRIKNEYLRQVVARELREEAAEEAAEEDGAGEDDATPREEEEDADEEEAEVLTPEESIRKRYRQVLTIMTDSDEEWVLQRYLSAVAHAYDPHSDYMSPSSLADFNIEMQLSLVGIGALLRSEDGAAKIVRLIPGGPAARDKRDVRLQPGDKIIAVGEGDADAVDILHWPLSKVVKLIRGEKGSRVVLTVIPASDAAATTTKRVVLVRDEVKLEEQAANAETHQVTDPRGVTRKLAVIKLPTFYANLKAHSVDDPKFRSAAYDVEKLIEGMADEPPDGILLDLRNNGGGSLLEAIRLIGLFISTGPAVQVREILVRVLADRDPKLVYDGPMVVLVNRLSASASEIVAGALQDYGRAVIVGDSKTHGKGTVQTIVTLGRDTELGSIKVTSASYYRINGSSTQLKGITPDIVVQSAYDLMELGEDFMPNAVAWSRIRETSFLRLYDLEPGLGKLRERSRQRRDSDPRFAAYRKLLERIDAMNKTRELPLDLATRREFARTEKELAELQNKLSPEEEANQEENGATRRDVVLAEALSVLVDYVALCEGEPALFAQPAASSKRGLAESIMDWMKSNL